jgi:hypothetical protein
MPPGETDIITHLEKHLEEKIGWSATVVSEGVHKGTWRGTGPSVQNLPRDTTDSVSTEEPETK